MSYELFERGPAVYIPILLVSLIITMAAYGAFPLIFARTRKKIITKRKYRVLCYGVNFAVMVLFIAINSEASYGGPYVIWTWVFSASGTRTLRNKGLLEGWLPDDYAKTTSQASEGTDSEILIETEAKTEASPTLEEKPPIRFCRKCGFELIAGSDFCSNCGTRLEPRPLFEEVPTASQEDAAILAGAAPSTEAIETESPKRPDSNKRHILIPLVLLVLLVASIGFHAMQYIRGKEATETVASQTARIRELERAVTDQNIKTSVQEATISAQKDTISAQKATIASLKREAGYFDAICEELRSGNIGYASNNFKSSESVIVVNQKERDRKFTLTANWTSGGSVSVDYSRSNAATVAFDNDSWETSTKMTVEPWRLGVTAVTFSNNVNSQTFKVLIIVTE